MSLVYVNNNRPVTDSLIVAEAFGKEHKNVMRDLTNQIEKMLEANESRFVTLNFERINYQDSLNREQSKYLLTEDAFALIAMSYTTVEAMRFKINFLSEFNRMRTQLAKPQLPSTFIEALEMLLDKSKENLALQEQAQLNAPKVALYDTAMNAGNNFTMMHVAKTLGIGRNKLFDFLREKKVLMKNNLPYESYVTRGYFEVRQYTITHFTTGLENKTQTLVTPKGMAWIHNLLTTKQEAN